MLYTLWGFHKPLDNYSWSTPKANKLPFLLVQIRDRVGRVFADDDGD